MAAENAELAPLDSDYVNSILSNPPFVQIEGVINARDLGSLPSCTTPHKSTKANYIFRSAELSGVTEEGKRQLRELGIKKVFDFRSDIEMAKYNSPLPEIEGVDVIRCPMFRKEDYSPEVMAGRYELYASGKTEAFMELYSQMLDAGRSALRCVLIHIRDHPSDGFIFHCTAGKDRTGVMAAILLKLVGVEDLRIADDYALTKIGREPAREKILARLSKEPIFATNNQAALNMLTCRKDTMLAFLALLQEKYGGPAEYCKQFLDLTDEDIASIKCHLLAPDEVP